MKHLDRMMALCVAASLLAACGGITRGQPIDHDHLASFQPGITTVADVERTMGVNTLRHGGSGLWLIPGKRPPEVSSWPSESHTV